MSILQAKSIERHTHMSPLKSRRALDQIRGRTYVVAHQCLKNRDYNHLVCTYIKQWWEIKQLISVSFCLKKLRPFADKELDRNTITVSAWHIGTPVAASNLQPHGESNQPAQSLCCAEKIHHFVNFPRMSLRHCPAFLQQLSVGCESWVCNLFVTPDASLQYDEISIQTSYRVAWSISMHKQISNSKGNH